MSLLINEGVIVLDFDQGLINNGANILASKLATSGVGTPAVETGTYQCTVAQCTQVQCGITQCSNSHCGHCNNGNKCTNQTVYTNCFQVKCSNCTTVQVTN